MYRHASQIVGTSTNDIKLLSPSTLQAFADQEISIEDAGKNILHGSYFIVLIGLMPRGLVIVQVLYQSDEDPR